MEALTATFDPVFGMTDAQRYQAITGQMPVSQAEIEVVIKTDEMMRAAVQVQARGQARAGKPMPRVAVRQ